MTRLAAVIMVLCTLLLAPSPPAGAQTSEEIRMLRQAVDALKEGQQRLERDLQEIKTLLRARSSGPPDDEPRNVVFSIDGDPVRGDRAARLVLVDFTDYQ